MEIPATLPAVKALWINWRLVSSFFIRNESIENEMNVEYLVL